MQDADENFKAAGGRGPSAALMRDIINYSLEFLDALLDNSLDSCTLPSYLDVVDTPLAGLPAGSPGPAAVQPSGQTLLQQPQHPTMAPAPALLPFTGRGPALDLSRLPFGLGGAAGLQFAGLQGGLGQQVNLPGAASQVPVLPYNIMAASLSLAPGGQGPPSSLAPSNFRPLPFG